MKKILNRILKFSIIILTIGFIIMPNINFAYDTSVDRYNGIYTEPPEGELGTVDNMFVEILGIIEVIAGLVATISLILVGLSFMKESPLGKAESKKKLVLILIGSFLIFGASWIISTVATMANQ